MQATWYHQKFDAKRNQVIESMA